jgi:hypothetical protein
MRRIAAIIACLGASALVQGCKPAEPPAPAVQEAGASPEAPSPSPAATCEPGPVSAPWRRVQSGDRSYNREAPNAAVGLTARSNGPRQQRMLSVALADQWNGGRVEAARNFMRLKDRNVQMGFLRRDAASDLPGYEAYYDNTWIVFARTDGAALFRCPILAARSALANPTCRGVIFPAGALPWATAEFSAHDMERIPAVYDAVRTLIQSSCRTGATPAGVTAAAAGPRP